ncbi:MAG TPA: cadherin domain-containing protein, partial [Solirubrobacterales bacterium]|nr:cadherin domain-containing protein [Solirubrobacterales bacterium]
NGSFEISGSELKTKASFDFETKSSYAIRVKTTDAGGLSFEKELTVAVENADDPPTDIALSPATIKENEPAGTEVGALSSTDQDLGDSFTYSLVAGEGSTGNSSFEISGNKLKAKASLNFEAQSSYAIRVKTTDSGGKSFEKQLTVTVEDVNDPPTTVPDTYAGAVGNTTATLGSVSVAGPQVALSGMSGNVPTANDSDEDAGDTISIVSETVPTTDGGSVKIEPGGAFVYTPGVGDENESDTFHYKVTDGEATTVGTVTIEIENIRVWYVNGGAASEGDGRSATPFKSFSELNATSGLGDADGSGDYLFIEDSGTYSGGLPLEANEKLVGAPQGLSVPGHPGIVAPSGTNPTISNAGGDAITLANGSEVQRVDAKSASGAGIRGTGVTTATVGSNTTISGNGGSAVSLSGAAGGEISIGSTIENQTGAVVSVANRNSGTVALTGPITSSNGGVVASSNTGAHLSYTGALHLTRSGGEPTFSATGGGGVKATSSDNQLSSGSGTAVKVTGTTIDSGGLNFKTVSSSGASDGIVLENTGSTAGLTVTGTGSAGSGGTISSSTGPGIMLSSTSNVSLASVKVNNGGDDGIRGTNVNGFSLTGNSEVAGNGNAVTEDGLDFTQLSGTVNLTGATVSGSADRNVAVVNESGTVNATFNGGTYSNTSNSAVGGDAIFFEGTNTGTIGVTVEHATFTNNKDDHVQVTTDASNTVTENVTIKENTMSNTVGQPGGSVTLNPGGNATMEASVLNNNIQGADIEAITVDTPGSQSSPQPAQVGVTISGNTIGNPAVAKSGAATGDGIGVNSNGSATVKALITNNQIYQYENLAGLDLVQNDGVGTLDATVRGNTINHPAAPEGEIGMLISIGADEGDTGTSCLDIGSTEAALKNDLRESSGGIAPFELRFRMNGEATAKLVGYGGGANDTAAVQSYLEGRNLVSSSTLVKATQFDATSKYASAASCPTP